MSKTLLVKWIGEGTPESPNRINLPTYNLIAFVGNGHSAIVDVPNDNLPESLLEREPETMMVNDHPVMITIPNELDAKEWESLIRTMYVENFHDWDANTVIVS